MAADRFDAESVVAFWREEADDALRVAEHLIEKADYSYALFFGHLAVEKALKAVYVAKKGEHAPPIHNLVRLARAAGVDLDDQRVQALVTITAFHLEARYPDVKRTFRQRCTPDYTDQQMAAIREVFGWARSLLP
jgi:HEPN domain-containing protein